MMLTISRMPSRAFEYHFHKIIYLTKNTSRQVTTMMISKNEIVSELAKRKFIENIIHKYSLSSFRDDLAQDLYIDLLSKDEQLIQKLYESNQIEYYIRKMIRLNLNSSTSRFYRNYIKYEKITDDIDEKKKY